MGLAALAAIAGPVLAQTAPANMGTVNTGPLAELCASADPVAGAYCRGFLIGAGQYHASITAPGGADPVFCLAQPMPSVDQAQASFAAWARSNPQHAGERAVDGVIRWAATAYPCPPQPEQRPGNRRTNR